MAARIDTCESSSAEVQGRTAAAEKREFKFLIEDVCVAGKRSMRSALPKMSLTHY